MSRENGERGFTLLELLISLSLLAVMMFFITSALNFSHQAWKQSEILNKNAPVSVVRNFLRRNISAAFAARIRGASNNIEIVFKGEQSKIAFATYLPDRVVVGGLYKVSVFQQNQSLIVNITPYHPNRSLQESGQAKELLAGVSRLDLSYFGKNTPDDPADWRSNWARTDIPPSLVKLNVQFQDGRRWHPLVVELKLD